MSRTWTKFNGTYGWFVFLNQELWERGQREERRRMSRKRKRKRKRRKRRKRKKRKKRKIRVCMFSNTLTTWDTSYPESCGLLFAKVVTQLPCIERATNSHAKNKALQTGWT